jgi:glutamine cyclotransferase
VEGEIRRDAVGFTEGLEVRDGALYESTGNFFGDTRINRIDPKTGHVSVLMNAGQSYFGEGMTFFGDRLYQMTYRENRVYVFDKTMRRLPTLSNPREGWGLTHDENQLIASDGSNRLYFLSPQDFSVRRILPVLDQGRRVSNLNELEYINGFVYANIWETDNIVKIDPETGKVVGTMDFTGVIKQYAPDYTPIDGDEVLNGIAYDSASRSIFVTGKRWPKMFEVKLN